MLAEDVVDVEVCKHHKRAKICETRSKYRSGRRETAVKVFTISDESKYLLIHNVPDIKLDVKQELFNLCKRFGDIESLDKTDYKICDEFTKVYLLKYKKFVNSVYAKKRLDDMNFLGSVLHVCYAPELESIEETKQKLSDRQKYVSQTLERIKTNKKSKTQERSKTQENHSIIISKTNNQVVVGPLDQSSTGDCLKINKSEKKSETLKRKFFEIDSHEDNRLNDNSKHYKSSSEAPKIRWHTNPK